MPRVLLPILLCSVALLVDTDITLAKGGGRGGGGPAKKMPATRSPIGSGQRHATSVIHRGSGPSLTVRSQTDRRISPTSELGVKQSSNRDPQFEGAVQTLADTQSHLSSVDRRLGNEDRKLDHRLKIADHLRANAMRNGNPNLFDTANRMEQHAFDHFDSRIGQLQTPASTDSISDTNDLDAPFTEGEPIARSAQSSTSGFPSFDDVTPSDGGKTLLNTNQAMEERIIQHQFDVAQKLRDISERNGNLNLIRTAERMEQMAITRYERSLRMWNADPANLDPSASLNTLPDRMVEP